MHVGIDAERHLLFFQLLFQIEQELVDHAEHRRPIQTAELDDGIETIAELRCEQLLDGVRASLL